jgi:hypothetical protein
MSDPFKSNAPGLSSPATRHYTVTPADEDLPIIPRALFIAESGDVVIRDWNDDDVTYPLEAGAIIPFRGKQVRTGTTATVIAWY